MAIFVHGMSRSRTYRTWHAMTRRCIDPRNLSFHNYGGRGISYCERWKDFEEFLHDMGLRPDGTSLDRIDNDGPYSPENCRWATAEMQHRNKRSNRLVTYKGETKCIVDWARFLGVTRMLLTSRLDRGWSVELAFETKPRLNQHSFGKRKLREP
jgi:hypothetical protein